MESKVSNLVVYYSFNVHSRLSCTRSNKGFVKDGNDEPLPGVSVAVKGATNVGTITNVDGNIALMPIRMTYWYSPISEWSARKSK